MTSLTARRHWRYYPFVLPALLLSALVVLLPAVLTVIVAMTEWDGVSRPVWVGLTNLRDLIGDFTFWRALLNNVRWMVIFLTIPMILALSVAAVLQSRNRSYAAYQTIFLLPYVLSPIANASIWSNMIFDQLSGVFGYLRAHGVPLRNPLGNVHSALYAVAAVDIWHFWGYLAVVFVAAMRQVPADQLEAAYLEGASGWQIFRRVTLPNMAPTIALMFVMVTIFSFLTFDYVFLMTGGGPARATELLSTLAYGFAFRSFEVGKAAAVALCMSLFGLLAAVAYVRVNRESLRR
jgi:raffinose/stachyose/melibiose transport system permease protein